MLKHYLLCCFHFFSFIYLQAQDKRRLLPDTNPKVQHVKEILAHMLRSANRPNDSLTIEIQIARQYFNDVAKFIPEKKRVEIQEVVYDSCMLRWGGECALANLIAHEFGHYLIAQTSSIVYGHSDTLIEAEADLKGYFYARLAGYNPCNSPTFLIKKMYLHFIQDMSMHYPRMDTRMRIAEHSYRKSDSLAHVFQFATYLLMLKQYDVAACFFDYLAQPNNFPSREMFFNAAIARLNWIKAHQKIELEIMLLFDDKTRASKGYDIIVEPDYTKKEIEAKTQQFLKESDILFQKSYSLDSKYEIAYLYAAYLVILSQEKNYSYNYVKAKHLLSKVNDSSLLDYKLYLNSIIAFKENRVQEARSIFLEITDMCSLSVPIWYFKVISLDSSLCQSNIYSEKKTKEKDMWSNYEVNVKNKKVIKIPYGISDSIEFDYGLDINATYIRYRLFWSNHLLRILKPQQIDMISSQNKIKIGDNIGKLDDTYGEVPSINSVYQVYKLYSLYNSIFFSLNHKDNITDWGIYDIQ